MKGLLTLLLLLSCFSAIVSSSDRYTMSLKKIAGDTLGGRGITFIPRDNTFTSVVIWMHGLGDTADGWASLMPSFGFTKTKFILPTAPNRPITINGGMPMPGWSDIYGLDASDEEDAAGFSSSVDRINQIIEQELNAGIPSTSIIVAGFSQGGAVALQTALRSPHSLGACIALSTWLPLHKEYPAALSPASTHIPVLQVHGDSDQVVGYQWGKRSHTELKSMLQTPPIFETIKGMGHSSDPAEISIVRKFLAVVVKEE